MEEGVTKGHRQTFEGDGYVYYLDCGNGLTVGYMSELIKLHFRQVQFTINVNYTSIKLIKNLLKKSELRGTNQFY